MGRHEMTDALCCHVAVGSGWIARREHSLLYLPDGRSDELIDRFRRTEPETMADVLTSWIHEHPDLSPAFALIDWSSIATSTIRVIVRGAIEVASDLESMPSFNGTTAAPWTEFSDSLSAEQVRFLSGGPADAGTDFVDGVIAGGGFDLLLGNRSHPPRPHASERAEQEDGPASDAGRRADRIASLESAGLGDWMHESLQLGGPSQRHEERTPEPVTPTPFTPSVEIPDGTIHRVQETAIIGRHPDVAAARVSDAVAILVDTAATVSRTHVRLDNDGQRLVATDCASSGGTLLMPAHGGDSVLLEPWTGHEARDGDRLYLGGSDTCIVVHAERR